MAYKCPFCGQRMKWLEKDVYECETHGRFEVETFSMSGFKWLEADLGEENRFGGD